MSRARHRAAGASPFQRNTNRVSWSLVAYLVIAVLAKHYFGIDVTPW